MEDISESATSEFVRQILIWIEKTVIAEKILDGEKLTSVEKKKAYLFLTGEKPPIAKAPKGRGQPKKLGRNAYFALDYLKAKESGRRNIKKLRNELMEKHGIKRAQYYNVLKDGLSFLYTFFSKSIDEGTIDDIEAGRTILSEIEKHRNDIVESLKYSAE